MSSPTTNIIGKSGHKVLTSVTGIQTEQAEASVNNLAVTVEAIRQGKFRIAGLAALCTVGSAILAGTNALLPRDVKTLNKMNTQ